MSSPKLSTFSDFTLTETPPFDASAASHQRNELDALVPLDRNEQAPDLKFTLFPKLPAELQLKIWKMAIHVPHIVKIAYSEGFKDGIPLLNDRESRVAINSVASQTGPPAILHVCHASRTEALKVYKAYRAHDLVNSFFYNPSLDTLLMENANVWGKFGTLGLHVNDITGKDEAKLMIQVAIPIAAFNRGGQEGTLSNWGWNPQDLGAIIATDMLLQKLTFIKDNEEPSQPPDCLVIEPSVIGDYSHNAYKALLDGMIWKQDNYSKFLFNVKIWYQIVRLDLPDKSPRMLTLECCTLEQLQARHG